MQCGRLLTIEELGEIFKSAFTEQRYYLQAANA